MAKKKVAKKTKAPEEIESDSSDFTTKFGELMDEILQLKISNSRTAAVKSLEEAQMWYEKALVGDDGETIDPESHDYNPTEEDYL